MSDGHDRDVATVSRRRATLERRLRGRLRWFIANKPQYVEHIVHTHTRDEHEGRLLSGMIKFDVVVIGAGPAGENAAGRCADGGLSLPSSSTSWSAASAPTGGIPSKTVIRPGCALAATQRVPGAAAAVTSAVDVTAALAWRDQMTSGWNDEGQPP